MTAAFVQTTTGSGSSSPTVTAAFPSATMAGNLIVVATMNDAGSTGTITSITDSTGNTFTRIFQASWPSLDMWYSLTTSGGASHTVSVTWSLANAGNVSIVAQEFSGIATSPLDVTKNTAGGGTNTSANSGATATTTQANELVVAVAGCESTTAWSAGSGFSNIGTKSASDSAVGMCSKVVSATGAQTGLLTYGSSVDWSCGVATFKASSGSPPVSTFVKQAAFGPFFG